MKLIEKIKDKINLKFLVIISSLFALTGCSNGGTETYIYSSSSKDVAWTQSAMDTLEQSSRTFAATKSDLYADISNMYNDALEFLNAFGPTIGKVIVILDILAVAGIVVRFALSIFKENMAEQNREYAQDVFSRLKKLFIAIVITAILPSICFSAFIASNYIGKLSSAIVMDAVNINGTEVKEEMNIFDDMSKDKVMFKTYCEVGQGDHKERPQKDNIYVVWIPESADSKTNYEGRTQLQIDYLNNKYCKNSEANVYLNLFAEGKEYSNLVPVQPGESTSNGFWSWASQIITFFVSFFTKFASAQRICELIFLIASSWWYISGSLTDNQGQSFSALSKKLLTICLSQFFIMFEMGIYAAVVGLSTDSISVVFGLAFLITMVKTPNAVAELTQSTGTATEAMNLAKGIGRKSGLLK